jgi:hypothetical protein
MDAGVVSGTWHPAPDQTCRDPNLDFALAGAGKVPSTLRVPAARGHLRRHRSSTMRTHRRRRASLHLTPRRS